MVETTIGFSSKIKWTLCVDRYVVYSSGIKFSSLASFIAFFFPTFGKWKGGRGSGERSVSNDPSNSVASYYLQFGNERLSLRRVRNGRVQKVSDPHFCIKNPNNKTVFLGIFRVFFFLKENATSKMRRGKYQRKLGLVVHFVCILTAHSIK